MFVEDCLSRIDEQILEYDKLINYQKNEILKTTSLISNFRECLSRQNEALTLFIADKEKLLEVKKKYLINYSQGSIIDEITISPPNAPIETNIDSVQSTNTKSNTINTLKRQLTDITYKCRENKIICLGKTNPMIKITTIRMADIKNNQILAIHIHDKDLYIGGSNGMLLRHTSDQTHAYKTNTSDDILQLAILKHDDKSSINAFTKDKLIIYEDITRRNQCEEIDVPHVGDIFLEDSHLYIPFGKGILKKISNTNLKKSPTISKAVSFFIPCYGNSKLALIGFEDRMLYTTSKTDPGSFRNVNGVSKLLGIRRLMNQYFVCYSVNNLWLLSSAFKIMHTIRFEKKILFVEVCEGVVVVIDGSNEMSVHSLVKNRSLCPKLLFREQVHGTVTAVSFANNSVYFAVGDTIVVIKCSN